MKKLGKLLFDTWYGPPLTWLVGALVTVACICLVRSDFVAAIGFVVFIGVTAFAVAAFIWSLVTRHFGRALGQFFAGCVAIYAAVCVLGVGTLYAFEKSCEDSATVR